MLELSQATRTINSTNYVATNTPNADVSIVVKYDDNVVVNIFDNERNENTMRVFDDFDEAVRWTETRVCMNVSFS